jgi:hypothetical protein
MPWSIRVPGRQKWKVIGVFVAVAEGRDINDVGEGSQACHRE